MDSLPLINKVYSMVIQEEQHRDVARSRKDRTDVIGFFVQVVAARGKGHASGDQVSSCTFGSVEKPVCSHCGKHGHEKTHCYQLIRFFSSQSRGGRGYGRGFGRGHTSLMIHVTANALVPVIAYAAQSRNIGPSEAQQS